MRLMEEIASYWDTRVEGYSEVNEKEWCGMQRDAWAKILRERIPEGSHVLDLGCGPGFFTVLLASMGYYVTAIDYTPGMLLQAARNLNRLAPEMENRVSFLHMDAQSLAFQDATFDAVVSRNLTWNLPNPEMAYHEWYRVLKGDGIFLNFDANWYGYLYDDKKRLLYEQDRAQVAERQLDDHYLCTDIDRMEQIALQVPMSATLRPVWDRKVLDALAWKHIEFDEDIWMDVWSEEEKMNYASTPMFMVYGIKKS